MSNQIGDLYQSVIEEVLENARSDFIERGEDDSVLNLLKQAWQQRLSEMRVGAMPWDAPVPPAPVGGYDPIYGYSQPSVPQMSSMAGNGASRMPLSFQNPGSGQSTGPSAGQSSGYDTMSGGLVLPRLPQTDGLNDDVEVKPEADSEVKKEDEFSDLGEGLSDLDDESEDELNSENDADEGGDQDVILSLYDKVQRVRNRWKYVLKDGIVNIGGKDYVFSRGTGESEW